MARRRAAELVRDLLLTIARAGVFFAETDLVGVALVVADFRAAGSSGRRHPEGEEHHNYCACKRTTNSAATRHVAYGQAGSSPARYSCVGILPEEP